MLRHAIRHLLAHPRAGAAVIATLALGIGSVTALFGVADAVLWRPLPFGDPDRLVRLWGSSRGEDRNTVNPLDALDWRARSRTLESVAVLQLTGSTLTGAGEPRALAAPRVTADFFATLGIEPVLGRFFRPEEERHGSAGVVVLSYELWQTAFGADPAALGRTLRVGGEPHVVVGVAPAGMRHFAYEKRFGADLWRPLAMDPVRTGRGGHFVDAVGRLAPGATVEEAQAELDLITARIAAEHPELRPYWGVRVEPLAEAVSGPARRPLLLLLAAGALVLLVACANVATLLLARAVTRAGEMRLRGALGAGRGRLLSQLLAEAAVLAAAGCGAGVGVAATAVAAFRKLGAAQIPRLELAAVDARALAAAVAVSALTVGLFGVAPALRLARAGRLLAAGARGAAGRRHRLERSLVVAEVALSLVLLVGAGLLLRTLDAVLSVDAGFDARNVATFGVSLRGGPQEERAAAAFRDLERRLEELPGVVAVGWSSHVPLAGAYSCDDFVPGASPTFDPGADECAEARVVTPGYFAAMRMRRLDGRLLNEGDGPDGASVVVVNRTLAERYWPGRSAVGQQLKWVDAESEEPWWTVVGVVADVRHFGLDEPVLPEVYMPHAQRAYAFMNAAVRTQGDPASILPAAGRVVRGLDAGVPLVRPASLEELVVDATADRRFRAALLGAFAAVGLVLAGIGVFGVLSHLVGERRGEIGVRMAVGARREQVLGRVLREGLLLAGGGLALGAVLVVGVRPLVQELLYGVRPLDPVTVGTSVLVLLAAALLAAWLPARRAAAVDPMRVLREG